MNDMFEGNTNEGENGDFNTFISRQAFAMQRVNDIQCPLKLNT